MIGEQIAEAVEEMVAEENLGILDDRQLALALLDWEKMHRALKDLEAQISDAVLARGKTQTVGNVRASYSGGRKTYLYEQAAKEAEVPVQMVRAYTTVKEVIDWRGICEEMELPKELLPFRQSEPSVTLKLLE